MSMSMGKKRKPGHQEHKSTHIQYTVMQTYKKLANLALTVCLPDIHTQT